jgi:hypothetical protein
MLEPPVGGYGLVLGFLVDQSIDLKLNQEYF